GAAAAEAHLDADGAELRRVEAGDAREDLRLLAADVLAVGGGEGGGVRPELAAEVGGEGGRLGETTGDGAPGGGGRPGLAVLALQRGDGVVEPLGGEAGEDRRLLVLGVAGAGGLEVADDLLEERQRLGIRERGAGALELPEAVLELAVTGDEDRD